MSRCESRDCRGERQELTTRFREKRFGVFDELPRLGARLMLVFRSHTAPLIFVRATPHPTQKQGSDDHAVVAKGTAVCGCRLYIPASLAPTKPPTAPATKANTISISTN